MQARESMFKKILCPVDFSPGAEYALHVAVRMAIEADAELVLVHVWDSPLVVSTRYPLPFDVIQAMIQEQELGLAAAARDASRLGAKRVTTRLSNGVTWAHIVDTLTEDARFDLVVVGTHGRTGIARVLLGSVADKVVRHAPCSVLAARPRGDVKAFEHVLCPIDFSDSSRHALALAAELAAPGAAGITLLHAFELPIVSTGMAMAPDMFPEVKEQAAHLLEQWAADLRTKVKVPVTTLVASGSPGARALGILDDDPTFDLVVVGSHGRTGLRRVLLGSVAEKIVRNAPCPVLVARNRAA